MFVFVHSLAIIMELGSEDKPTLPIHSPHLLALSLATIIEQAMGGSSGAVRLSFHSLNLKSVKYKHKRAKLLNKKCGGTT